MAEIPVTTDLDLETPATTLTNVRQVLQTKYADAGAWAEYAATLVESKLTSINTKADDFDIAAFIAAAQTAIEDIPDATSGTVTYTAPTEPTYGVVPAYSGPTLGAIDDITYVAPTLGAMVDTPYVAPAIGTLVAVPEPTSFVADAAPDGAITFANDDFSDTLADALKVKLIADLATPSTGLGDAEAALFARETARQDAARALAYTEIATQFEAREFDMPPGALLAKQTEVNNESGIRLSDSSSQIMAESAKLAQEWNRTTVTASTQFTEVLSRVFDSKIMRNFEAAKQTVLLSFDAFKAGTDVLIANADLEGKYIKAVSDSNENTVRSYVSEIDAAIAEVNALIDVNKGTIDAYTAEIGGEVARVGAMASVNEGTVSTFVAEIQAAMSKVTSIADSNKAMALSYSAAVSGAAADVSAQGEAERANATVGEINSRKAIAIANLSKDMAMSNIDAATRKFLGEIGVLQGSAQSATQLVAAALNGVSVSTSLGYGGSSSKTESNSVSDSWGGDVSDGQDYEHNPDAPT